MLLQLATLGIDGRSFTIQVRTTVFTNKIIYKKIVVEGIEYDVNRAYPLYTSFPVTRRCYSKCPVHHLRAREPDQNSSVSGWLLFVP